MVRLLFNQFETWFVADVEPLHAALLHVIAKGGDGGKKLALFDGESADFEVDWRAFLQQKQRFKEGNGVFPAGQSDGNPVSIADHIETLDSLTHFS